MKQYRIAVFRNNAHKDSYFDDKEEAVGFGREQVKIAHTAAVFLLRHVVDGKYDIESQIV